MNFKIKILFSLGALLSHGLDLLLLFWFFAVVLSLLFRVRTRKNESLLIFSKKKKRKFDQLLAPVDINHTIDVSLSRKVNAVRKDECAASFLSAQLAISVFEL